MGIEVCDLIEMFLFNNLRNSSKSEFIELYRDEGLIVSNRSNCKEERISKNL